MQQKAGNEVYSTLTEIRTLMNRSSRFLNVSAYAPIAVGILALIAVWTVNRVFNGGWDIAPMLTVNTYARIYALLGTAVVLVLLCIATAVGLSYLEARRSGMKITIDATARRLLWNFFLPLIVGGVFSLALFVNGYYGLTSSIMLIFYGMALVSASNHTFSSVRYLGYAELALASPTVSTKVMPLFSGPPDLAYSTYSTDCYSSQQKTSGEPQPRKYRQDARKQDPAGHYGRADGQRKHGF